MKSIYQMELEDKFNRKIKYREKKIETQRKIIGEQREQIFQLKDQLQQKDKEIERLHSIIKEVREYITYWHYRNDFRINSFTTGVKEELLEIIEKELELENYRIGE